MTKVKAFVDFELKKVSFILFFSGTWYLWFMYITGGASPRLDVMLMDRWYQELTCHGLSALPM